MGWPIEWAPICRSLKEVTVHADHEVLSEVVLYFRDSPNPLIYYNINIFIIPIDNIIIFAWVNAP
jgi:hypothetical protein